MFLICSFLISLGLVMFSIIFYAVVKLILLYKRQFYDFADKDIKSWFFHGKNSFSMAIHARFEGF